VADDQPALTFTASATGATDAVDVLLAVGWRGHLDDVGYVGEIHAARGHV